MAKDRSGAPALGAFAYATVGVASLDEAVKFWTDNFGFEVTARRSGADAELAALWNISAADIARQGIVKTPGASAGALHLVEFARPGAPVRQNARVFDQLPKNLDIYVRDLPARFEQLKARGVRFRSDPVTAPGPGGMTFREVHMPGHDDTNVVLLEVVGAGHDICPDNRDFAGIGPLVTIVPSLAAEEQFYERILGLPVTLDMRLDSPIIGNMLGLPPGAALRLKVFGDPAEPLGRVEIIEYEHTVGSNLFARARAPARGTLHVTYQVPDLEPILNRLAAGKVPISDHGTRDLIYGSGRIISCQSPAGFRLEVQEKPEQVH